MARPSLPSGPGFCHTLEVIFWERVFLAGPGWSCLVQPWVSGSQGDVPGGTQLASPSSRSPPGLPQSAPASGSEPEATDSYGRDTSGCLTGLGAHTCTPVSGYLHMHTRRDACMSFPMSSLRPREGEVTRQLAEVGQPRPDIRVDRWSWRATLTERGKVLSRGRAQTQKNATYCSNLLALIVPETNTSRPGKMFSVRSPRLGAIRLTVEGKRGGTDSGAVLSGSLDPLPPSPLVGRDGGDLEPPTLRT